MLLQLSKHWLNNKWRALFTADDIISNTLGGNFLLDDFCKYCNYTILLTKSKNHLIISRHYYVLDLKVKINHDSVLVTYGLLGIPHVYLEVAFSEYDDGKLGISYKTNAWTRFVSGNIIELVAGQFVKEASEALIQYMNKLEIH